MEKSNWETAKEQLMKEAYQAGYDQGLHEGRRNGQAEYDAVLAEAEKTVELSKTAFAGQVEKSEKVILDLAIVTAERILNASLVDDSVNFVPLVKRALREARDYKEVQIHVHPSKYELLTSEKNELDAIFPNDVQCYLYPNGDLDEHACYIESENGRIDASIDSQLQEIKRKLMDILEETSN